MEPPPAKKARLRKASNLPSDYSTAEIEIDPAGDIVLEVGEGTGLRRIRVASKILTLTSPYFGALLGPRFREGSVISPNPLRLVEDDPQAMLDFCGLVHHQFGSRELLDGSRLINLAVVCDKYGGSAALHSYFVSQLEQHFRDRAVQVTNDSLKHDGLSVLDIVAISSIVDDPALFWRMSHLALVIGTKENICMGLSEKLRPLLPEGFLDDLRATQTKLVNDTISEGQSALARLHAVPHTKGTDVAIRMSIKNQNKAICPGTQQRVGRYMSVIWSAGLWPANLNSQDTPLADVVSRLSDIKIRHGQELQQLECKPPPGFNCAQCKTQVEIMLKKKIDEIKSMIDVGWCIRCLRAGEKSVGRTCERCGLDKGLQQVEQA